MRDPPPGPETPRPSVDPSGAAPLPGGHWLTALAAAAATDTAGGPELPPDPKPVPGRVLSVKLGFNPNSSSVGSMVSVLFWGATATALALNLAAALLSSRNAEVTGGPAGPTGPGDADDPDVSPPVPDRGGASPTTA